ncbi:hypothetical protein BKG82_16050 [Mycobacteroides chelonae]|jgi:hypothetical protein|uniref:Uncharacterized protein n=1 Tax=Mycobacteroides chelonae TaxID=1774 RepID=A0A1S1LQH5_MYCCH|nr:hypothetical protein AOT87_07365 [Mycobacteroides sp. H003]KRQ35094.1 hypothetical protein AOT91_05780 [Mycobacteroides sp. H092]KRQ39297.1 hypothetical protein AOT92_18555 [Mycobacteroides sp. H101]KRQ48674.1 hypothetical protein AOT88_13365 [Mycobacteroides sp. H063]KRQ58778.1 hypothetical protein AOT94_11025 [Mycobacteroides sp. HXVII]KRQ60671.1 hypothetical protein AOT90_20935 [Mycobacteroides sp. H079]KRQ75118.1 hypothetical protein AOT93_24695 [Mycobacteroides sp. H110]KRQ77903.1 hy
MAHKGCTHDDLDTALKFGQVRGLRLVLASLHGDDDARQIALDELEDCPECLRCMASYLAGMAGSIGVALAESHGFDADAAVRQFETQLTEAVDDLPS